MNAQQLIENYRLWLANTLANDTKSVIDTLNKNGFPTSYSVDNSFIIEQTLKGLQLSKSFGDELNNLIAKNNAQNIQNFIGGMKKAGFASQFENTTRLSAYNLGLGPMLQYPENTTQIFEKNTTFDNCSNC
jgi:hypothetical protein